MSTQVENCRKFNMFSLPILLYCGGGILTGIIAHLALFIHGEWHIRAPELLIFHTLLFTSALAGKTLGSSTEYRLLLEGLLYAFSCYVSALLVSIVVYRLWFHRLTRDGFPGPWYLRLSKLCHVWEVRTSRNYLLLEGLRQKYGDFVRTGPAEITVFHPEVFSAVDGPRSQCVKSEWYDLLYPFRALVSSRDKSIHASRRREWVRGFTTKALVQHEEKILKHIDKLDQCLEKDALSRKQSEMRDLCFWFGFDAMGNFIFSKSFDMLSDRKWHSIVTRLQNALSLLGPLTPAPWLVQLGLRLSPKVWVIRDWHDTVAWGKGQMRTRMEQVNEKQIDLTHYLMEQGGTMGYEEKLYWVHGDSLLAVVAGSEPTAYVLLAILCELAKHPHHTEKIYEELREIDVNDLKVLEFEVLTGAGEYLKATPTENQDLYWALSGGGGGTYGLVHSMTVKAYADVKTSAANLTFSSQGVSSEAFNSVIQTFLTTLPNITDSGVVCIWLLTNTSFTLSPASAPNLTAQQLESLLQPTLDSLSKNGIPYNYSAQDFPSYLDSYNLAHPKYNITEANIGGRFIPRSLVSSNDSTRRLMDAMNFIIENGGEVSGVAVNVTQLPDVPNSVNPAWRTALFSAVIAIPYGLYDMQVNIVSQGKITNMFVPKLAELTPSGAAYLNEADPGQPDFQEIFYGANYDKLLSIKQKYDPNEIFYGLKAVGSEAWQIQADGRLCRVG
ncbi:cytochrome P450 [Hypoxylon trugodes]|uniref:cytochrome P450 n=1 Tax=Hypoxylon trugodes TaxID=326681 RepID=UPI00218DC5F9|nr:cytochrome P450 [Hypoxylon trugodes]KAI1389100.1 cytochrome P450 [Hypoxylon trugodes]